MTRLVQAELLKLCTTRTTRVLLAVTAAGTATATFLVTPVRGRVVEAKLLAAAVAGLAVALVAAAVVLAVALPWLPAKGVDVPLADPGLGARLAGLAAVVSLHAVVGTAFGALFHNQFAAVVVGLLWWQGAVADVVAGLLRRPGLGRWLPDGAAAALTTPGAGTLPMWAGGLVLAAYGLGLALLGGRLVVRRDLT